MLTSPGAFPPACLLENPFVCYLGQTTRLRPPMVVEQQIGERFEMFEKALYKICVAVVERYMENISFPFIIFFPALL